MIAGQHDALTATSLADLAALAEQTLHRHRQALAAELHDDRPEPATTREDLLQLQSLALEIRGVLDDLTHRPALQPWAPLLRAAADGILTGAVHLDHVTPETAP